MKTTSYSSPRRLSRREARLDRNGLWVTQRQRKRYPQLRLIPELGGPYFKFNLVTPGTDWHCHFVNLYHGPTALPVPDCVGRLAYASFERAHDGLREYWTYGDAEFYGNNLNRLIDELGAFAMRVRACRWKREFSALTNELFVGYCEMSIGSWQAHWPRIRDEVAITFEGIITLAEQAKRENKVLLFFGV